MISDHYSMVVYHVTPEENVFLINKNGIDPRYSRGKMKASWYVSRRNIEWAIIHTSVGHHEPIENLVVCAVHVMGNDMYKFNRPGFYYTYKAHQIESASPAMFFLHSIGLGEVENE